MKSLDHARDALGPLLGRLARDRRGQLPAVDGRLRPVDPYLVHGFGLPDPPRLHAPTAQSGRVHFVPPIDARNSAGYDAPIGLTADPVVFTLVDGRLSVLLARRLEEPQRGMFALPGGFVGTDESPEQTAERKLREKTGVGSVHLEQLRTYAQPDRDPRGWLPSIAYLALVRARGPARRGPAGPRGQLAPGRRPPATGSGPRPHRRRRPLETPRPHGRQGLVRARRRRPPPGSLHARPGPAVVRGAARRAGRPSEFPPRRQGHRPARSTRETNAPTAQAARAGSTAAHKLRTLAPVAQLDRAADF